VSSYQNTATQQNDPAELLEVHDATGAPTGQVRTRAEVHLRGDWHVAFHCWVVRSNGDVVMQRRSLAKDTFGGLWDAAAAGHWRAGETPAEAAREVAEELGIDVPFANLHECGRERISRRFPERGLIDREHHRVYVLRWEAPFATYRPDPREVSGLGSFPAERLLDVLAGRAPHAIASEAVLLDAHGAFTAQPVCATRADFVPYSRARLVRMLGCARGIS
jgi:isopentenyldiphosphate isomerase